MAKTPYFDVDTRPVSPESPLSANPIRPQATRRRYSHTFSAGRRLKKIINSKGQPKWRRLPDAALVHYGKVDSVRSTPETYPMRRRIAPRAEKAPTAKGFENVRGN